MKHPIMMQCEGESDLPLEPKTVTEIAEIAARYSIFAQFEQMLDKVEDIVDAKEGRR